MGSGATLRMRTGRSDIWLIAGITLALMFATIMVVLRLIEQTDQHVKNVSRTRVKYDSKKSPSLNEVERQIQKELKENPKADKVSYSGMSLTKRCFKYIRKMRYLDNVDLSDATFENEWLEELTGLKLVKLTISGTNLDDEAMKHIGKITTLERLLISQTQVTDAGIKEILPLQRLQQINLRETKITDASMETLTRFPQLWLLDISGTKVTAKGIQSLPEMKKLIELYIADAPLNVSQLRPIKALKKLNFLQLDNCAIGDAEFKELCSYNIWKLQLFTNKITAAGIKNYISAKKTTVFKFTNDTNIPESVIAELRKARPEAEIEVKGPMRELMQ